MPRELVPTSRHARLAGAMNRRLVDQLSASRQRRRLTPGGFAIYLLATAVHAVTAAFLVAGLWLVALGDGWPMKVAGGFCLLVPIALLPGLTRRPEGNDLADTAPATMSLISEIARLVDSPVPRHLYFSDELNASAHSSLIHGRTLVIGAPLWVACSPAAQVALLAHELGHFANRDLIHGRYVAAASHSIVGWHDIFSQRSLHDDMLRAHGIVAPSGSVGARAVTWPVRAALRGYLRLMDLANAAAGRRQEHYADLASVSAAGTDGAVDLLETILAADGLLLTANRVAVTQGRPSMRPALEGYMAAFGPERRTHARADAAAKGTRIDDSHPPTVERLRLVESIERTQAAVDLDQARASTIDQELTSVIERELVSFADAFRGC